MTFNTPVYLVGGLETNLVSKRPADDGWLGIGLLDRPVIEAIIGNDPANEFIGKYLPAISRMPRDVVVVLRDFCPTARHWYKECYHLAK